MGFAPLVGNDERYLKTFRMISGYPPKTCRSASEAISWTSCGKTKSACSMPACNWVSSGAPCVPRPAAVTSSRQRKTLSVTMHEPVACARYIVISKFGANLNGVSCPPPSPPSSDPSCSTASGSCSRSISKPSKISSTTFASSSGEFRRICRRSASRGSSNMLRLWSSFISSIKPASSLESTFIPCDRIFAISNI